MITLQNISKSYKDQTAVDNLNLNVDSGEILGLLGANGAGKSTTINMILGLIKPDSGKITVHDIDVDKSPEYSRQFIGYIPENVNLYNYLTGIENLNYFCLLAGLKYSKPELQDILETCGLDKDSHHRKISTYSKGMRQKVGIAIAYAKKAKVLLLDEPASGLDPLASNELSVLLKQLASNGTSILMASHDIFRVREVCNRIGILKQGRLVKTLNSNDVSANELESLYLQYMKN
ncbi:ABC transporter ATP-binding protein [Psychroserpens sp.]|uniref:ABC transporter ATP-binding protein n=1 Tax=Psychroserpens sp. TaxID=2020870 RepID=UPI001B272584|nr:ABC transporter ATP-binding protein [Psychroserpens sp.]MBO6607338.1 ABC transporter ATP-binding protein [Psychroserpens sp.]MBO6630806.1 ABC transporter ATP-binding protein [Psychroserpens sp.]MBO6654586.1 ABC transporter ATP-binding protein [Psychroserpens sp.]MBO6681067.1 ABC transporter ATP-binding protein [Psychroserpens sp.]MBO6749978.1 ABC transporter ATP-binding protein [Psychroserpens sp.]